MSSDFTYAPSYTSQRKHAPRALLAQFGDGYEQRAGDGINTNPQEWDLTFENLGDTDADALLGQLDGYGAVTSFTWTPPRGSEIRVVCRTWSVTYASAGANTIAATFTEVFEP